MNAFYAMNEHNRFIFYIFFLHHPMRVPRLHKVVEVLPQFLFPPLGWISVNLTFSETWEAFSSIHPK